MDVAERDALGADVAARQRVVGVAADAGDAAVLDREHEAADRLAQVADPDALFHPAIVAEDPPPTIPPGHSGALGGTRLGVSGQLGALFSG